MSWEQRGRCRYYYQVQRDSNGSLVKTYCGTGVRALLAYHSDLQDRTHRQAQRQGRAALKHLDHQTQTLYQAVRMLAQATYYTEGWYQHHREWRRKRVSPEGEETMVPTSTAREPVPSIEDLQALVRQAKAGDTESLPAMKHVLDHAPSLWQDAYSLSKRVENAWISAIAKQGLLQRETLKRQVQALRLTLADASTNPLEGLLIDVVCTTFLALKQAELTAAQQLQRTGYTLTTAQQNHLTACQKRYLAAIRELGRMRQLLTPRPATVLHIAR